MNIALWFGAMGLANKGVLEYENDEKKARNCAISYQGHGEAFELLVTAAYHAMHEFGGAVGVSNPGQYEILLSDPRERRDQISVPVMRDNNGTLGHHSGSPYQRKPDLVLAGDGEGKRYVSGR